MPTNLCHRQILLRLYDENMGTIGESWETVSDENSVDSSHAKWIVNGTIYQVPRYEMLENILIVALPQPFREKTPDYAPWMFHCFHSGPWSYFIDEPRLLRILDDHEPLVKLTSEPMPKPVPSAFCDEYISQNPVTSVIITTPTALQKTQLVIILWHKLIDIITLREILVNVILCGFTSKLFGPI
jgi:hypothetical protein